MFGNFHVGDKVVATNFVGNILLQSEVTEITKAGNIRIKGWEGLFCRNGTEKRVVLFWTDIVSLVKVG